MGMEIFQTPQAMRAWSRGQRTQERTVGFVPTMGCLHQGHLNLVNLALARCDVVVVSIYVNPTQFAEGEDFDVYPKQLEADLKKLEAAGAHAAFTPVSLYQGPDQNLVCGKSPFKPGQHDTYVVPENTQKPLCGKSRPHFFRGVATVVTKLFNIVEPDLAVFGKKDYQQWRIISTLVRDLDFAIEVVGGDIHREGDGLALSSRNKRLSQDARGRATCIYQGLTVAMGAFQAGLCDSSPLCQFVIDHISAAGGEVDYVDLVDSEHLQPVPKITDRPAVIAVAAWFEGADGRRVRLIDNVELWGAKEAEPMRSLNFRASLNAPPTV